MTWRGQHVLVTGADGFIGSHLVRRLKAEGYWVRGVDIKYPQWSKSPADEWRTLDLRDYGNAAQAVKAVDWVIALAASMGGAFFIFTGENDREIMTDNVRINANTLRAASKAGVQRYLFSSSACIYPEHMQMVPDAPPLKECDAYPAGPDSEYGWEKLFTERLCAVYHRSTLMGCYVVRFHNVYGPEGEWCGEYDPTRQDWEPGKEKAPAAMCRKVARAKVLGDPVVEIWGDGEQTRSFMYIDDCLEGLLRLIQSDYHEPLNLGRDRMISINELVDIIASIFVVEVQKRHIAGPLGVRGRNSDNSLCREVLGWAPEIALEDGLAQTSVWIWHQVRKVLGG